MVIVLYVAAAALLIAGFVADSPFTSTDLIVLAAVCFLLARFIRIERRLDKIEGVQRESKIKGTLTWVRANGSGFVTVVEIAAFIAFLWYGWGRITQSVGEDWAIINPNSPHLSLHAFLASSRAATAMLVWFPIGTFLAFLLLAIVAFYAIGTAVLIGIWPQRWLKAASSYPRNSRYEPIVGLVFTVVCAWSLLAMTYANKETDAFFALLPGSKTSDSQALITVLVLGGWMPLGFIARAVQRRRERQNSNRADSSI
jgi:hypothetical protein